MMEPEKGYKILEWDSNFLGFKTASIISPVHTVSSLDSVLSQLKKENANLVYWASNPDDPESQAAAEKNCGFLADKKATYFRDLADTEDNFDIPALIEEYKEDHPDEDLLRLAILSGVYSRFKTDIKIPHDKFEELYKMWMINSVNKKFADKVFVYREKNKITGMVTVQKKEQTGIIGIIAVDSSMQGKSIGTSLVNKALSWSVQNKCEAARVVTQSNNIPACRLYIKCGYSPEKIENFYHFWLK